MRRLTKEMTIHSPQPVRRHRDGAPVARQRLRTIDGNRDLDPTRAVTTSSSTLANASTTPSWESELESVDADAFASDTSRETRFMDAGTRARSSSDDDEGYGAHTATAREVRRLESKCARLEATVSTLRDALEARSRSEEKRHMTSTSGDNVVHDALVSEIVALRQRVTRANVERERLIEMSNDLRAALKRNTTTTTVGPSSSPIHAKSPTKTTSAIPLVEATPAVRPIDSRVKMLSSSSSERETQSQKVKLKRAIRRAKELRSATPGLVVRNWNRT